MMLPWLSAARSHFLDNTVVYSTKRRTIQYVIRPEGPYIMYAWVVHKIKYSCAGSITKWTLISLITVTQNTLLPSLYLN